MAPTVTLPLEDTESPTSAPSERVTLAEDDPWYSGLFESREHEANTTEISDADGATLMADDGDALYEEPNDAPPARKILVETPDPAYETNRTAEQRARAAREPSRDRAEEDAERGRSKRTRASLGTRETSGTRET
jgi:hypothetical protein